jgi:hypothetical protein
MEIALRERDVHRDIQPAASRASSSPITPMTTFPTVIRRPSPPNNSNARNHAGDIVRRPRHPARRALLAEHGLEMPFGLPIRPPCASIIFSNTTKPYVKTRTCI